MAEPSWKQEIEKKYCLQSSVDLQSIQRVAEAARFKLLYGALQRDWMPDFADWLLKRSHILLRIRTLVYEVGGGPLWVVTLKRGSEQHGIRHNYELEATSDKITGLKVLERSLFESCGIEVDLRRVVENDIAYLQATKLTTHRMLIEKRRYEYESPNQLVLLALDTLPSPLGYFTELEVRDSVKTLNIWERRLGLDQYEIVTEDYGELVKSLQPDGNCRTLIFPNAQTTKLQADTGTT